MLSIQGCFHAQVLTSEQVARAMVHAYPWLPDIMAVAAVVAAEEGDAEALSHLRADSSGGPGAFVQALGPPKDDKGGVHIIVSRKEWAEMTASLP